MAMHANVFYLQEGINCYKMAMNTRDERLYHYEYRRPRVHNPTYNSVNVFDSLNMFVRTDLPDPLLRSYPRYSLPRDPVMQNRSEVMDSRTHRPLNYSTIQPPAESPRRSVLLNDKDYLYLQMIEEKKRQGERTDRMASSRMSQNAENMGKHQFATVDSLTNELREFQAHKK